MIGVFKHSGIPAGINYMWIQNLKINCGKSGFPLFLHQSEDLIIG